ncbi:DUF2189 domain-containing protein [Phenylobacterium sp.]|uniref:DUF2189 domain-containing protein n=1 Tax=Phenylobacterium sp. TaxID=1871053 RepID=UPI0035B2957B
MEATGRLPAVRGIDAAAPFRWLGWAWRDLWTTPGPLLLYGLLISATSLALSWAIYRTNAAFWVLALTFGFVFVAPMLAMGPYEAGRRLDRGELPRVLDLLLVRKALRQDVAYLGLALLVIYFFWGRIAQIVYGLSTWQIYRTIPEFLTFALTTAEGQRMLLVGSGIGGIIAYGTFVLVAVSAPMLLDPRASVFAAVATSVRAVSRNPGPMLLWALVILALVMLSAATAFVALIVVFPWLGLASWRAYRELVAEAPEPAAARPLNPVATR